MWLAPGQSNGVSNPVLNIVTFGDDGIIVDAFSINYQIFKVDSVTLALTEVVPLTALNLVTNKVAVGQYAPTWAVPGDQDVGPYQIRWFVRLTATSAEVEYRQDFQIATVSGGLWDYPLVSIDEARTEGYSTALYSDARVFRALKQASRFIEQSTGQFFTPRRLTLLVDGDGTPIARTELPIIAIESVVARYVGTDTEQNVLSEVGLKIYNRHLKGVLNPDDRKFPRVEVVPRSLPGYRTSAAWDDRGALDARWRFPKGPQNIVIKGLFGYTDQDGSPMGGVPDEIKWATLRLAQRYLPKATNQAAIDALERSRMITSEATRDQSWSIGSAGAGMLPAPLTGDSMLDAVLMRYRRPPASKVA